MKKHKHSYQLADTLGIFSWKEYVFLCSTCGNICFTPAPVFWNGRKSPW